jgi:hypothetical protein
MQPRGVQSSRPTPLLLGLAILLLALSAKLYLDGRPHESGPQFPPDCARTGPIYFAAIDGMNVRAIAARYERRFGVHVGVLGRLKLPASAFDKSRDQLISEEVVDAMQSGYAAPLGEHAVIIGLTDRDMYPRSEPTWRYAYSHRQASLAIVSTARVSDVESRLYKLITKNLGVLYCGYEPRSDPRSVLYGRILGPADLDEMDESVW